MNSYIKSLSRVQKVQYLSLLKEKASREKYNKIKSMFPDEGEHRRELYVKQLEFFTAGAYHRERLFMAGNRCVTPWTYIETASGERPALESFYGLAGNLRSWAGEFECGVQPQDAHLKGIEPAFRVVLDNGAFFDCSRKHQLLTSEGWSSLDQIVSASSGLHCSYKLEDYQASCAEDGYLCDPQLQDDLGIDRASPQKQGDAHKYNQLVFSLEDAKGRIPQYIHAYLSDDLQANLDELHHVEALSEQFRAAKTCSAFLPLKGKHQELQQLALELRDQPLLVVEGDYRQSSSYESAQHCSLYRVVEGTLEGMRDSRQLSQQLNKLAHPCLFDQEQSQSDCRLGIFYPCKTPELFGGRSIVAITPIGFQPIIDVQIEGTNNYKAGGVYHHNCGKTEGGGTECSYHLTGNYPDWWTGREFNKPIRAMVAGDTSETTRDILQKKLLGGKYGTPEWGSGLIPLDCLGKPMLKQGVSGAYSEVPVKHKSGEWSSLKFRSYDQGRRIFQGQELEFFWADEECPYEVYEEGLLRTATTKGIVILTFTPLTGLTPLVLSFLESRKDQELGKGSGRYVVQAGWSDVPHLDEAEMAELEKSIMPHQRAARRNGEPSLGAGAIYPIDKADFEVKPFMIPRHWSKGYALDVGWNKTAAVWGAWDRDNDIVYLYSEHYMGRAVPAQHVEAIKGRGSWMLGTIDPAAKGRSQADGNRLIEAYEDGGLNIIPADNAVEAGIYEVWSRLSTGRLKVCSNLSNWFSEFGLYRRNEHGKIVKENDHIMDATRYLIMMLIKIMTSPPAKDAPRDRRSGDWRS